MDALKRWRNEKALLRDYSKVEHEKALMKQERQDSKQDSNSNSKMMMKSESK